MCDDLKAEIRSLEKINVKCGPVTEQRWGILTEIALPGGGHIGMYQPKHPKAIGC